MKISTLNVVMFSVGTVLLYSGIKAYDPRDVIKWGLGGKKPEPKLKAFTGDWEDLLGPNEKNPDPGQRYPGDLNVPDPDKEGDVSA